MANDIDIVVGVKDLATSVLDRLSSKVTSIGDSSKLAFAGAAERLNDQIAKASSGLASGAGNDKLAKTIEQAANGLSTKLDAALAKTNSAIDGVTAKIQGSINSLTGFIATTAGIASTAGAFVTVYKSIKDATTRTEKLSEAASKVPSQFRGMIIASSDLEKSTSKAREGILGALAPYSKYVVAASATATLTKATLQASDATRGLVSRATAVGRGALAAFVLQQALKKTENGATTLTAKLAKVAAFTLAADVATRATLRFGLSVVGLGKKADDTALSLLKTANAGNTLSKISTAPFNAVKSGANAAALATANLNSKFDELPKGAQSVNSLVEGFGRFATTLGGIPGLLLAIPAGIAGAALAAVNAASQTEHQLFKLTNKLQLVEAAKLNVKLDEIDTAPLRKVAEETSRVSKMIQTATNIPSSKLMSLATSALTKGLDSSQLNEAMKGAVGLAEVYNTDLLDGMYRARQAMDGNFEGFEKLIPAIKTMTTLEEKLAAVNRLASNGFKITALETMTFWGAIERLKNGLWNTLESLGKMKSLSDVVATVLRDVVGPAVDFLDTKLKGFGFDGTKIMEQAKSLGAGVIAAIDTIGNNWTAVVDRMTTSMDLFWVRMESSTQNFVKNTLPWLGENLGNVFKHAANSIATNGANDLAGWSAKALENAGLMPKGLSNRFDKMGKPFETTDLPTMKGRDISPLEKALEAKLSGIDAGLGAAFGIKFNQAKSALDNALQAQRGIGDVAMEKSKNAADPAKAQENALVRTFAPQLQAFSARLLTRGNQDKSEQANLEVARNTRALLQEQKLLRDQMKQEARFAPKFRVHILSLN